MLPSREQDRLTRTAHSAMRMASLGKVAAGYTLLLIGLQRAEALRAEQCPWSEELWECYRQACRDYVARYPVPLSGRSDGALFARYAPRDLSPPW